MPPDQSDCRNLLLAALPQEDFLRVAPGLEQIDLPKSFELSRAGTPLDYCYFFESGVGSIVARSAEGQSAEVGLVGREGMSPSAFVLGSDSCPHDIFMQVAGDGYRIEITRLTEILSGCKAFEKLLRLYVHTLSVQTAYTALSNAVHTIDERLARWILMCHDRTENDEIGLTHEFMALMLAVRRPSVTTSLHALEGNQFIYSERGVITVRNRTALQSFAADAYDVPESEYRRLIGPFGKS